MLLFLLLSTSLLDSLVYHYSLNKPEQIQMVAKCSIAKDTTFKVHFVKEEGIVVEGQAILKEIVRSAFLSTSFGLPELYENFGGAFFIDTVIADGKWFTIIPKDDFLFITVKLKIENCLIKEFKIKTQEQDISAKITYKSKLPINIVAEADSFKYVIKHKYQDNIPSRTEITGPNKHIVITYKEIK